jgi:hypothetical protein
MLRCTFTRCLESLISQRQKAAGEQLLTNPQQEGKMDARIHEQ